MSPPSGRWSPATHHPATLPWGAQEKGRCWSLPPWMQSFSWGDSWTLPVLQPVTQPATEGSTGAMDDLGARPGGTSPLLLLPVKGLQVPLPTADAPRSRRPGLCRLQFHPRCPMGTNHSQEINHLPRKARVASQCQRELCCSLGGCHPTPQLPAFLTVPPGADSARAAASPAPPDVAGTTALCGPLPPGPRCPALPACLPPGSGASLPAAPVASTCSWPSTRTPCGLMGW